MPTPAPGGKHPAAVHTGRRGVLYSGDWGNAVVTPVPFGVCFHNPT
jgi:hypothetical protein